MSQPLETLLAPFVSFTDEEWNIVRAHFTPLNVPRKTQLVKLEKIATSIYFIVKGAIRTYYFYDVDEIHTGFYFENSFATSFSSFLYNTPSTLVVETLEQSELLCMQSSDYKKLNHTLPKMNILTRKIAEQFVRGIERQTGYLLCDDRKTRLLSMIADEPEVLKRVSQQSISSYLDIPLLALSKMLMNL